MFCTKCGARLKPGDQFCPGCGQAVGAIPVSATQTRLARHLRLLGVLWLAISGFRILGGGVLMVVGNLLFPSLGRGFPFDGFLPGLLSFIAVCLLIQAVLGFVAGWGLLERRTWARMLAVVLGLLALLDPPFGTALGVYTLWVLLPGEAEDEFRRLARAA